MNLKARVEKAIAAATDKAARLVSEQTAHGGSINRSSLITLSDGRRYFLKTHAEASCLPGMFAAEFEALSSIEKTQTIRVPVPLAHADDFIIMEVFNAGSKGTDWQEKIGRQLAELHSATRQKQYGFKKNNYLGASLQLNSWRDRWCDFWREYRLGRQLTLFSKSTDKEDALLKLGERLMGRLDDLLGHIDEPAVLLHGDLWSGNAAADENGEPVIYDPASYYGHREAEIGMMRMFGGFGARCEAAYAEVWPLQPGHEERIKLYRLYHELNHLNLFGHSYYQSCITTLQQLIRGNTD